MWNVGKQPYQIFPELEDATWEGTPSFYIKASGS